MMVEGIIAGVVGGALYALAGYLKAREKNGEKFDAAKFGKTILLGAVLGALNYALGLGLIGDDIAVMALAGEVAVIEQIAKAMFGRSR
ncbi:MAG: hypothetical protein QW692_00665 [Nitrososphaerota archaeon]